MVSMDAFASAFGFDAKSDDVWTTLGKVTAVGSGTLSVLLGGSATPTTCEAYCLASVGDIVFVAITKGRARAIACKGVDAATWRTALGLGSMATEDSSDYLPLTGGTTTGAIAVKASTFDSTKANNDVSTTKWPTVVTGQDKNGKETAFFGNAIYANGNIVAGIWSYNYDTDGNQVSTSSFGVLSAKDGTVDYMLNVAAFKKKLGIYAWGQYLEQSSALSLTTSSQKIPLKTFNGVGCEASANGIKVLNAGTYVVSGTVYMSTGFTAGNLIHVEIYKNTTLVADCLRHASMANPYETWHVSPAIVTCAADDVLYLYAYNQNSSTGTAASRTGCGLTLQQIA